MGGNLSYVASRAATFNNIHLREFAAKKVSAFWSELILAKGKWSGWLGYAFEDLTDEEQLAIPELKKTEALLAGIQYAAGSGINLGLEFSHFLSAYFQSDKAKAKTSQVMFSAVLSL